MDRAGLPPRSRLWLLCTGFANTAVLHALVRTGVIEQLRDGSRTVSELAAACRLDEDVLFRTLRFAAVRDVVSLDERRCTLAELGKLLLADVPGSLHGAVQLIGSRPWQGAWNNLSHALETGDDAFDSAMGTGFFQYLEQHPEYGRPYNQWMSTSTAMAARAIADAYDFTPFRTVCDVGGGQGTLLRSILSANPHLHGTLFDQESVLRSHVLSDFGDRAAIRTGSFFESVPTADLLMMKSVLHDWDDDKCRVILGHCRKVMQQASRLLIVEMVIASPPDETGTFYDLHMQALLGGRERTEPEFRALLESAGLALTRLVATSSPMTIVEAALA